MGEQMKVLYYNGFHTGHFPHMVPYYKKLGGLVFITDSKEADKLRKEYKDINVTSNIDEVTKYNPDVIMYADYHPWLGGLNTKSVMVFHAMEHKGYMAVKRNWNYCEKFDLCLLYGEKVLEEFKANNYNIKHEIIGYPRFDDITEINKNIFNNDRKIILVAPTWSHESLLTKFTDEVIELSNTYNVIVKPHPATLDGRDNNKDKLTKLLVSQSDTLKVFNNSDILPLMKYSDMMITDVSGCSSEYMFFDKPLIIADCGVVPVATGKQPDIWKVFKVTNKPEELSKVVESQFKNDEMKQVRKDHFKQMVYNENKTTATERGIKAIKKLFKSETFI